MRRLVVFVQNKGRDQDQMPRVSALLDGMFNRIDKPLREELDPVRQRLHVTEPELITTAVLPGS